MTPFWPHGEATEVSLSEDAPAGFRWGKQRHRVRDASARWRVHTQWWTGNEIWRDYWEITTNTGLLCVLYCDLLKGAWHLERIYE